jgi:broad specificity phosphatase PhoE
MAKTVELRRHTDANADALTEDGIRAAVEIGSRLTESYDLLISSGAQAATQTLACFLAGMDRRQPYGVTVDTEFRSGVEERWFAAAWQADGKDLEAFRRVDPELVVHETEVLGGALGSVFQRLAEDGRALVVGHSPSMEAAVFGLTAQTVEPVAQGGGVRIIEEEGRYRVEPLA